MYSFIMILHHSLLQLCCQCTFNIVFTWTHYIFSFVDPNGIEPMTSWMQIRRSPSWATDPWSCSDTNSMMTICSHRLSVGPSGLEPPTSRLSGVCSNQLSYRPMVLLFCQLHDIIVLSKQRTEAVLFIPSSIAEYLLRDSLIFYVI